MPHVADSHERAELQCALQLLHERACCVAPVAATTVGRVADPNLVAPTTDREGARPAPLAGRNLLATANTQIAANLETTRAQVEQLEDCLKLAREESSRDQITGLANRRHFYQLLDETILKASESEEPTSLLVADIDHFKAFNDTYGHIAGDSALRYVASCIKSGIKNQDTAARIGGEQFAVILPHTGLDHAVGLAERIRHLIHSRTLVKKTTKENMGNISVSIGVTELLAEDTALSLLDRADMCMYAAKKAGRNQVMDVPVPATAANSAA